MDSNIFLYDDSGQSTPDIHPLPRWWYAGDPQLRLVACGNCDNLEVWANMDACFLCDDALDLCYDCLRSHQDQKHTKEEIEKFFREVGR